VVTIHDLIFMRYPEFYKPIDRKIYFKKVKYACHSADKIIAISRQTKHDIETFFHVPPEKVELIYQPVSPVFYEKQNVTELLEKYHLPKEFILSVGTLEPRKNQLALLQALQSKEIQIRVVFVGKQTSSYMTEIKRFLEENEMESQVQFLSNIPESDLAALYQTAVLSVYISVFEGFGLPVIESMACGCPVVTSSVSVLPETAGDAAVLCNPAKVEEIAQKVLLLLENDDFRNEMIKKGKQRANLFHPENYAQKLISLYTEILKRKHA
jgi:glycosyltransferase involved in cell wall biosynthesis